MRNAFFEQPVDIAGPMAISAKTIFSLPAQETRIMSTLITFGISDARSNAPLMESTAHALCADGADFGGPRRMQVLRAGSQKIAQFATATVAFDGIIGSSGALTRVL